MGYVPYGLCHRIHQLMPSEFSCPPTSSKVGVTERAGVTHSHNNARHTVIMWQIYSHYIVIIQLAKDQQAKKELLMENEHDGVDISEFAMDEANNDEKPV